VPPDHRFVFLRGPELAVVASPEFRPAVRQYLDGLSVVHDAIEQAQIFQWDKVPPRFLDATLRGAVIERTGTFLGGNVAWRALADNLDLNVATALALLSGSERFPSVQEFAPWIDRIVQRDRGLAGFANDILKQYVAMRLIRMGETGRTG